MSDTDTPRTDALIDYGLRWGTHEYWQFARQLERELAAANERINWYKDNLDGQGTCLAQIEDELAAARKVIQELLKHGQHEGPCDNVDEYGYTDGACSLHLAASREREEMAKKFLSPARNFTNHGILEITADLISKHEANTAQAQDAS